MNYWLVIHSLDSYKEHPDLIGCPVNLRYTKNKPRFKLFSKLAEGDKIVYYAKGKKIVGLFQINSDMLFIDDDPKWGSMFVYSIAPIAMASTGYIELEKIIPNPITDLEIFQNAKNWASVLQGKVVLRLSVTDYIIFENFFRSQRK